MMKEIVLPELGEGIESGEVVNILVSPGDVVTKDTALLELETDKAVIELPSPDAGTITQILIQKGETVRVGQVLFTMEVSEASGATADTTTTDTQPPKEAIIAKGGVELTTKESEHPIVSDEPQKQSFLPDHEISKPEGDKTAGKLIPAGPAARRLARDLGIDLSMVKGTGRGGRITPEDVKAHAKRLLRSGFLSGAQAAQELPDFSQWGPIERKPLSSLRQKVAQTLSSAWPTIPLVTQFDEADITELEHMRKKNLEYVRQKGGKLTMTVFVLKAVVAALKAFPQFNASLDIARNELIYKRYFNIGVAVDTPAGLLVPVLKHVDQKSFTELAIELTELSQKARDRKVSLEELRGGNLSVSNLGGIGGTGFTPLVNPPDVAVVGLSRTKQVPVWKNDKVQPRLILPFSVSYDHRVIDGADGVRFARAIAHELETYQELLLEG